jgi:hypothetical protein
MQARSLDLPPWQPRPYSINIATALREPFNAPHGRREGAELLKKLLALGLSRYEPDPMAAIARVEAGQRTAAK